MKHFFFVLIFIFLRKIKKTVQIRPGDPGAELPSNLKSACGQSQIICPKNTYPRPKIVMKQVYMKATELKINVVSCIFNFPLIYACLSLDL